MPVAQKGLAGALSEDNLKNLKTEVAHWKLRVAQALREWCVNSRINPKDLLKELEIGPAGKHILSATSICRTPEDLYARLCLRTRLGDLDPRTIPPMLQRVHGGYEAVPRAWDDSRFNVWLQERGTTLEQLEKQLQTYETNGNETTDFQSIVALIEELGGRLIVGDAISFLNKLIPPYLQCGQEDVLARFREDHEAGLNKLRQTLNRLMGQHEFTNHP